jgi:phosphatidylserine/phosphatidylglycerophosphate/cardiolipin synthase-like enzyme
LGLLNCTAGLLLFLSPLFVSSRALSETVIPLPTDRDSIQARFDILRDPALTDIDFTTYTLQDDEIGSMFLTLLIEAAKRGVHVRGIADNTLYDGTPELMKILHDTGVKLRFYHPVVIKPLNILNPVGTLMRFDKRMHDKLFVAKFADGHQAIIDGDKNYRDIYFESAGLLPAAQHGFLGRELYIEGDLANDVRSYFEILWNSHDVEVRSLSTVRSAKRLKAERARLAGYLQWVTKYVTGHDWQKKVFEVEHPVFFHDDFDSQGHRTKTTLDKVLDIIRAAPPNSNISIENAYVVLNPDIEAAFRYAKSRGSKIRIVTNSPVSTDEKIVATALMMDLPKIRELGIDLYFTTTPNALHSKLVKINDTLLIMSANIDPRSLNLNSESAVRADDAGLSNFYQTLVDKNARASVPIVISGKIILPSTSTAGFIPDFLCVDRPIRNVIERVAIEVIRSQL